MRDQQCSMARVDRWCVGSVENVHSSHRRLMFLWSAGSTGDVHRKSAIECGNASIATVAWSASIFLAPRDG